MTTIEIEYYGTGIYREVGASELEIDVDLFRFTVIDESTEELDVDARDKKHARAIATAAWAQDYEGEPNFVEVIGPRTGLYL